MKTEVDFQVVTCVQCGVPFCIQTSYHEDIRDGKGGAKGPTESDGERSRGYFYCPNGHRQCYTLDKSLRELQSENKELQTELARMKQTAEKLEAENETLKERLDAVQDAKSKAAKRTAARVQSA